MRQPSHGCVYHPLRGAVQRRRSECAVYIYYRTNNERWHHGHRNDSQHWKSLTIMAVHTPSFNTRNAVAVPQGKPHAPSYPDLPKEVHPEMQRAHRVALDMIYDVQQGIRAMAGGA